MADNESLKRAKKAKQDEFYTRLEDIEDEVGRYWPQFEGTRVLCNCDDPRVSNFARYFVMHFDTMKLKHLTATCWKNTNPDLFSQGLEEKAVRLDWDGSLPPYRRIEDFARIPCSPLKGDGDFRSDEVKAILAESDIVVTNPPFSLFREYITQLVESGKKFLVIGNQNAITYKEIFPLIMRNKLWTGYKLGDMSFRVPKYYEPRETRFWIDGEGQKWRSLGTTCWFTNLDVTKRHAKFQTGVEYKDGAYRRYDNYDAIDVPRMADIPMDYDGVMGVPITFLDRYNPDVFEILGATESEGTGFSGDLFIKGATVKQACVDGEHKYKRMFIRFRR